MAIYTVVHEESESEVYKCKFLEPGGKIWKNYPKIQGQKFLLEILLFVFLGVFGGFETFPGMPGARFCMENSILTSILLKFDP